MPNWTFTLKFSPWYRNEDLPIKEKAKLAAAAIRRLAADKKASLIEDDLLLLAENFDEVTNTEEFDDVMEELYDMGDLERIWVATV